jgi:hypothetical protein
MRALEGVLGRRKELSRIRAGPAVSENSLRQLRPTVRSFNAPIPRIVVEKEKPEPRGSGSRELHNLSSYRKIIARLALEVNVTEGDSLS